MKSCTSLSRSYAQCSGCRTCGIRSRCYATIVPKCFEGESFKAYREAEQQRREAEQAQTDAQQRELDALLETQKRVLDDPESSEEDKGLARKILGFD